jgi:hypothetical protein
MPSNLRQFNQHRKRENPEGGIINTTVSEIMGYVIDCYLVMLEEKPQYSRSVVNETTTYKFEDYLSDRFVDDYLRKNRDNYFNKTRLSQIIFTKQSSERYKNHNTDKEQPDLIDIYVTRLNLDKELCSNPEPYFAIECKRFYKSDSIDEYIGDIKKYTEREYYLSRLPFEAQIAFIENPKYVHDITVGNINRKLQIHPSIETIQPLKSKQFHQEFEASYTSKHKRNFGEKESFTVYHLFFDYTELVVS